MSTNISSTQLDFNTIKEELKTHFLASSEFADYDFEASGLSNILDVLAYNTHYNGLIANFALNEAFLSTAQLRSSVLAISEGLGYNPRSKTAASAVVNLSVSISDPTRPAIITLPAGTTFTTSVEDINYTFRTLDDHVGSDNGSGLYTFLTNQGSPNITIYEGTFKTKTFVADVTQGSTYIIPDDSVDTSTASVKVYATRTSESFETYLPLGTATTVDENSTLYILRESANGYYQLVFGDGITTGKAPAVGEIIEITYLSTKAALANSARTFTAQNEIKVNDVDYSLAISLVSPSAGGDEKESINSIKTNAPTTFTTQNRLVTANDYIALIKRNYGSYLDDATAWGGEDNIPADFGNVYVALKFKNQIPASAQTTVKNSIETDLAGNLSIMSIDTKFTDVITTYIETQTTFNYDPELTNLTSSTLEGRVQDAVNLYFTNNLKKFNKIFRRSNLLAEIDNLSEAILNTKMEVKVQQRLIPTLSLNAAYNISFPVALQAPNNSGYSITSTSFTQAGKVVTIRNKINTNQLEAVTAEGEVVVTNIGSYTPTTGKVNLVGLNPTAITASVSYIKISAVPANSSTIKPLRNYVFENDSVASFASAQLDNQNIKVTL